MLLRAAQARQAVLVVCGLPLLLAARANGALPSVYYYRLTRESMRATRHAEHAKSSHLGEASSRRRLVELPVKLAKCLKGDQSFG